MIGSLRGSLLDRTLKGEVTIEVQGVGYRVVMAPATAVAVGEVGGPAFVWVHHHIREDAQVLYGFATPAERDCFEALLGAHGVGPALALAILSVHTPAVLHGVVASDDIEALCLVPGVGKKTAARLLIELKARLSLPAADAATVEAVNGRAAPSPLQDVREALAGLGYGPDEVRDVLRDLPESGDAGTLLREALQRLAVRT